MKHNVIALYKHACEMLENPKGVDSLERSAVRTNAKNTKAKLEEHFRTAPKYRNDPEIQALLGIKEEPKEEPKPKEEKKEDVKKPK